MSWRVAALVDRVIKRANTITANQQYALAA